MKMINKIEIEREKERREQKINKMPQESYHLFELREIISLAIKVGNLMPFSAINFSPLSVTLG